MDGKCCLFYLDSQVLFSNPSSQVCLLHPHPHMKLYSSEKLNHRSTTELNHKTEPGIAKTWMKGRLTVGEGKPRESLQIWGTLVSFPSRFRFCTDKRPTPGKGCGEGQGGSWTQHQGKGLEILIHRSSAMKKQLTAQPLCGTPASEQAPPTPTKLEC